MRSLVINGGAPLSGSVRVGGAKNAALPILFSTIAIRGVSTVKNVPDITDVADALRILADFGALIERRGSTVTVDTRELKYKRPSALPVSKIRASTYLIGACLSRFGICHLMPFGGCNFSKRPIDLHLYAAERMGASVDDGTITVRALSAAQIRFDKVSVGATVNALIMAASARGVSEIYGAAREPHIIALIDFLRSAGADIEISDSCIRISGSGELHGGSVGLIGDMIEAGTYLAASLATHGDVAVSGVDPTELAPFLDALEAAGAEPCTDSGAVRVRGELARPLDIRCAPYPAFPTDLQPICAALCALFKGGRICDTVWSERFGYLASLSDFGVGYRVIGDTAIVYPNRPTLPATVTATDLRGGAACVITALAIAGQSTVNGLELIERGYESIEKKLHSLGARIKIKCTKGNTE